MEAAVCDVDCEDDAAWFFADDRKPSAPIATNRHTAATQSLDRELCLGPIQYFHITPKRNVWLFCMSGRNTGKSESNP